MLLFRDMATSNAVMIAIFMITCIEYGLYLSREKKKNMAQSVVIVVHIFILSLRWGGVEKNINVPEVYVFWR
jgi:hypothetical protein